MKNKYSVIIGFGAVCLAAFLWSLDGVFLRPKFYDYSPLTIVFLEHLLGLILLSPLLFKNWRNIFKIKKNTWLALGWVALFGGLLGTLLITKAFFLAIDGKVSFATVIILQKLQPIFALLLARIILKEKLNQRFYYWALLAISASYLLAFGQDGFKPEFNNLNNQAGWFALGASFAFGSATVFGKRLVNSLNFFLVTVLRFALTVILTGLIIIITHSWLTIISLDKLHWQLLFLIVFSSGAVAMTIYYFGLKKIPASLATIAELFWPLSAIILDYILNKNVLNFWQWLATAILLVAFYKITIGQKQREQKNERQTILYQVSGKVVTGKSKGQKLGYPTANLLLKNGIPAGVYEGKVFVNNKKYKGAIFIDRDEKILEVHIINFSQSIYNQKITVVIIKRLREVIKFNDVIGLQKQIAQDIQQIK